MIIFDAIVFNVVYFFRGYFTKIFTNSEELFEMTDYVMVTMIVFHFLDFIQGTLMGTIKALYHQKKAMYINFVTYYVFVVPLSYLFTFKQNLGIKGIWYASIIGIIHQICAYLFVIHKSDWEKIKNESIERQK